MSRYTTQVRFICEQLAGYPEEVGFPSVDDIIKKAAPKIFNFQYPIFDENYRIELETIILRHYYTREICAETVGVWKLWLEARMCEIMPYYNQLFKSELLKFPPFQDVDYRTTHHKDNSGTSGYGKSGDNDHTSGYGLDRKEDKHGGYGKDFSSDENGGYGKSHTLDMDETTDTTGTMQGNAGYGKDRKENTNGSYDKDGNKTDKTTYDSDISTSEENEKTLSEANHSETDTSGKQIVQGTVHADGTTSGSTHAEHESSFSNWDLFHDTPQGHLNQLESMDYLTNATKKYGSESGSEDTTNQGTTENDTDSTTTTTTDTNEMTDGTKNQKENGSGSGTKKQNDTTNLTDKWDESGSDTKSTTETENGSSEESQNTTGKEVGTQSTQGTENGSDERHTVGEESGSDESHLTGSENQSAEAHGQFQESGSDEYDHDEDFWEHVKGKMNSGKSYSQMLLELRETFLRIDDMIIKELEDLFFLLY